MELSYKVDYTAGAGSRMTKSYAIIKCDEAGLQGFINLVEAASGTVVRVCRIVEVADPVVLSEIKSK